MQVLIQIIEIKKKTQIDHFIELRRSQHVWGKKRIYIWIIYLHNILFF
jgi:hypothetical protein